MNTNLHRLVLVFHMKVGDFDFVKNIIFCEEYIRQQIMAHNIGKVQNKHIKEILDNKVKWITISPNCLTIGRRNNL